MKTAVRYYTKTGNTKRLAEAVANAVGAEALPLSSPIEEPVDLLFLGNSYYAFSIDPEVRSFIRSLDYDARNGLLWIGSSRGVFHYDLHTQDLVPALREQASGCIGSCLDSRGNLWIGCREGLYVFDLQPDSRKADGTFRFRHYAE